MVAAAEIEHGIAVTRMILPSRRPRNDCSKTSAERPRPPETCSSRFGASSIARSSAAGSEISASRQRGVRPPDGFHGTHAHDPVASEKRRRRAGQGSRLRHGRRPRDKAAGSIEHDGRTYYFCSRHCVENFVRPIRRVPGGGPHPPPGIDLVILNARFPSRPIRRRGRALQPKDGLPTPARCTRRSSATDRALVRSAGWRWSR